MIRKIIERFIKGYKLSDDLYISGGSRDTIELCYKNRRLVIYIERLGGKPNLIFYAGQSKKLIDKQEKFFLNDKEFKVVIDLLINHFERFGNKVEIDWSVVPVGCPTVEDIEKILLVKGKSDYKINKMPDGSIRAVSTKRSIWLGIFQIIVALIVFILIWLVLSMGLFR